MSFLRCVSTTGGRTSIISSDILAFHRNQIIGPNPEVAHMSRSESSPCPQKWISAQSRPQHRCSRDCGCCGVKKKPPTDTKLSFMSVLRRGRIRGAGFFSRRSCGFRKATIGKSSRVHTQLPELPPDRLHTVMRSTEIRRLYSHSKSRAIAIKAKPSAAAVPRTSYSDSSTENASWSLEGCSNASRSHCQRQSRLHKYHFREQWHAAKFESEKASTTCSSDKQRSYFHGSFGYLTRYMAMHFTPNNTRTGDEERSEEENERLWREKTKKRTQVAALRSVHYFAAPTKSEMVAQVLLQCFTNHQPRSRPPALVNVKEHGREQRLPHAPSLVALRDSTMLSCCTDPLCGVILTQHSHSRLDESCPGRVGLSSSRFLSSSLVPDEHGPHGERRNGNSILPRIGGTAAEPTYFVLLSRLRTPHRKSCPWSWLTRKRQAWQCLPRSALEDGLAPVLLEVVPIEERAPGHGPLLPHGISPSVPDDG